MTLLADGLLILATLSLAIYCMVISRRLKALGRLDRGMGAAIAGLSHKVDEMKAAIATAQAQSGSAVAGMTQQTARAEQAAGRLELLLATLHDSRSGTSVPIAKPARQAAKPFEGSLRDAYKAMKR